MISNRGATLGDVRVWLVASATCTIAITSECPVKVNKETPRKEATAEGSGRIE